MSEPDSTHATPHAEAHVHDNEHSFALPPDLIERVMEAIASEDMLAAHTLVAPLPAPDQAELFEQLSHDDRRWLTTALARRL